LAGLFWPDYSEPAARHTLSQTLLRLRKTIGDDKATSSFLLATPQTIQFNPNSDYALDVEQFVTQSTSSSAQVDSPPQWQTMHQAIELYRGDFLEHFYLTDSVLFDEWVLFKRAGLRQMALTTLEYLTVYYERQANYKLAEHYARREIELDPYNEMGHRRLMRVLARSGQRNKALIQYQICAQILAEELEIEPTPETEWLRQQIKAGVIAPTSN
jgi:DNA-binding SARP family transcriptional activator